MYVCAYALFVVDSMYVRMYVCALCIYVRTLFVVDSIYVRRYVCMYTYVCFQAFVFRTPKDLITEDSGVLIHSDIAPGQ